MPAFKDKTGQVFGRLTVIRRIANKGRNVCWLCECSCGNTKEVITSYLSSGDTKSCGCLNTDTIVKRNTSHNLSKIPEYSHWLSIKARCYSETHKDYSYYGGKGITMADEWLNDFSAFYEHIGSKPADGLRYSVDRIDSLKNYEPGNVRWATDGQQAKNQGMRKDNKTGVTGVIETDIFFAAIWKELDGTGKQKTFYKSKYGEELAEFLAINYREKKIWELNKLGAGYTPHHGK